MRAFLIVLDSVGIGAAPDAALYGDEGANTLAHTAAAVGGLRLPAMEALGLGNIPGLVPLGKAIRGVAPRRPAHGAFGAMQEVSRGKDTTTGHWEIAGLELASGFALFPAQYPSFPPELVRAFEERTGRRLLGNRAASGTQIIAELGPQQMREGAWIAYTSADSVFQIAAHEEVIPLEELYAACRIARRLCDPLRVGRVIARPYTGKPGAFLRTANRRDYSYPLPEPTILDRLLEYGLTVTTVGKLDDVFNRRGISRAFHEETSAGAIRATLQLAAKSGPGLVFVNLIDFDMLYGHRRDPRGYAAALEEADRFLATLLELTRPGDTLIVTADHGNDPTFRGTDHTREYVPLLARAPGLGDCCLGIRRGFFDVAQSLAALFNLPPLPRGRSFLGPDRGAA